MDVSTLNNPSLLALAFGLDSNKAEEAEKVFFPARGEHFAMDVSFNLRDRLKAAVEIDRRIAIAQLDQCSNPKEAKACVQRIIGPQEYESFWVIYLDTQNRVIASIEMTTGTTSACPVYPREIVKKALSLNATGVILAHNHPSGDAKPSRSDEHLTETIKASLALVEIRVLDHFIATRDSIVSMSEMGLM